jgi:hypothetical protein
MSYPKLTGSNRLDAKDQSLYRVITCDDSVESWPALDAPVAIVVQREVAAGRPPCGPELLAKFTVVYPTSTVFVAEAP